MWSDYSDRHMDTSRRWLADGSAQLGRVNTAIVSTVLRFHMNDKPTPPSREHHDDSCSTSTQIMLMEVREEILIETLKMGIIVVYISTSADSP